MKNQVTINWFKNIDGFDNLKKKYYELLKEHHPDKHINHEGNRILATQKTQQINAEWEYIKERSITSTVVKEQVKQEPKFKFGGGSKKGSSFYNQFYNFDPFAHEEEVKKAQQEDDNIYSWFKQYQDDLLKARQEELRRRQAGYQNPFASGGKTQSNENRYGKTVNPDGSYFIVDIFGNKKHFTKNGTPKFNAETEFGSQSKGESRTWTEYEKASNKGKETKLKQELEKIEEIYRNMKITGALDKKRNGNLKRYIFSTFTSILLDEDIEITEKHYIHIAALVGFIGSEAIAKLWFRTYETLI